MNRIQGSESSMINRFTVTISALLVSMSLVAGPAVAQAQSGDGPPVGERGAQLREAMQRYFEKRLRADLALSDDQVKQLTPLIRNLEKSRREAQRDRSEATRALQRALRQGGDDAELRKLMQRIDRATARQWEAETSLLPGVDSTLSIRQQAQFRFFVQDFRREMQEKIREVRERRPARRPQRRRR